MEVPGFESMYDALITKGLVASRYILDINRSLTVASGFVLSGQWDLPSRLFRFPIEISQAVDGERHIGLMHPLLADHPFVRHVETELGITLDPKGAPNAFGVSNTSNASWWHAVDLVTAGQWRALLDTRHYTTEGNIAAAVVYGLTYSPCEGPTNGYLSTDEARQIMNALGTVEPADRHSLLTCFSSPQACSSEKGVERWPINAGPRHDRFSEAWAFILGIEASWFKHDRSGFLGWTLAGRDRYTAGEKATFTETSGQGAFAF